MGSLLWSLSPATAQEATSDLEAECLSLLNIVGQTQSQLSAVFSDRTPDSDPFVQVAGITGSAATEFETVSLTDEQLQGYRDRFVSLYTELNLASQDVVTAEANQDLEALQRAYMQLPIAGRLERDLIQETKVYCRA